MIELKLRHAESILSAYGCVYQAGHKPSAEDASVIRKLLEAFGELRIKFWYLEEWINGQEDRS